MITCPVNDWTCPCFDSEGDGKCKILSQGNEHLSCEFLNDEMDKIAVLAARKGRVL